MSRCKSSMELHEPNSSKYGLGNTYNYSSGGYQDDFFTKHQMKKENDKIENEKFEKIYQDYKKMVESKSKPAIGSEQSKLDLNNRKIYLEEKFKKLTKKIEDNFGK